MLEAQELVGLRGVQPLQVAALAEALRHRFEERVLADVHRRVNLRQARDGTENASTWRWRSLLGHLDANGLGVEHLTKTYRALRAREGTQILSVFTVWVLLDLVELLGPANEVGVAVEEAADVDDVVARCEHRVHRIQRVEALADAARHRPAEDPTREQQRLARAVVAAAVDAYGDTAGSLHPRSHGHAWVAGQRLQGRHGSRVRPSNVLC
mmetsp:Transcript_9106/g.26572  ORF Transcript_9106/g.26572 Transcript_9106/m.26572 type:complete len:211 (+) Transcript_9106:737-1369(+)